MSVTGTWQLTMETPFGVQTPLLEVKDDNTGTLTGTAGSTPLEQLNVDGQSLSFTAKVATPMGSFPVSFSASVEGDKMSGVYETMMGKTDFTGVRK